MCLTRALQTLDAPEEGSPSSGADFQNRQPFSFLNEARLRFSSLEENGLARLGAPFPRPNVQGVVGRGAGKRRMEVTPVQPHNSSCLARLPGVGDEQALTRACTHRGVALWWLAHETAVSRVRADGGGTARVRARVATSSAFALLDRGAMAKAARRAPRGRAPPPGAALFVSQNTAWTAHGDRLLGQVATAVEKAGFDVGFITSPSGSTWPWPSVPDGHAIFQARLHDHAVTAFDAAWRPEMADLMRHHRRNALATMDLIHEPWKDACPTSQVRSKWPTIWQQARATASIPKSSGRRGAGGPHCGITSAFDSDCQQRDGFMGTSSGSCSPC